MLKENRTLLRNTKLILGIIILATLSGIAGIFFHRFFIFVGNIIYHSKEIVGLSHVRSSLLFYSLIITGILSAFIWFILQRKSPIISIEEQMRPKNQQQDSPPIFKHLCHVLLQITTVALGSPIGKEVAPREFGALVAGRVLKLLKISEEERQLLIASGAAAGLTSIYQVPLASTFFAFESLKLNWTFKNFGFVFLACEISNLIVKSQLQILPIYDIQSHSFHLKDLCFSLLLVVLLTPLSYGFSRLIKRAKKEKQHGKNSLYTLPIAFFLLACFSLIFPEIIGNGEALAKTAMINNDLIELLFLASAKAFIVLLVLWAGGYGGTLTPSFSVGVTLGAMISLCFSFMYPFSKSLAMLLGAEIFLSTTMNAPLTALFLVIGFTGQDWKSSLVMLAVLGMTRGYLILIQRFFGK